MAREDSIHIKIKIDVDPQDKEFVENLSKDIAKADETKVGKKQQEAVGPLTKTQTDIENNEKEIKVIKKRIKQNKDKVTDQQKLKDLKQEKIRLQITEWKQGNVGKLQSLSSQHFSNLRQAATNPGAFILGAFTKKLGKYGAAATKGGIYAIIALIAYEAVLFAIDQLMKPGRWLDRRYRRIARQETLNFYERRLQEDIRHGYQEIRVTTIQGLRGGASQVNGGLFEFSIGTTGLTSSVSRSSQQVYGHAYLSGSGIDNRGNPKRTTVSGRFSP